MALIGALGGCTSMTAQGGPHGRVSLSRPFEIASAGGVSGLSGKVASLAEIDPGHPLADPAANQTLSLFGREDLIAATSTNYRANHCAPLAPMIDTLDDIERRARLTSIVIINESHERSEHRGFIADVARRLRPSGYDTLAIETLMNNPSSTPKRYLPTFLKQPELPYLEDGDGFYSSEAGFGRLGRLAKALGYRLVPYEFNQEGGPALGATWDQRIADREEGQARNLASFLRDNPGTKLLIHVGYDHAAEVARANGARWMAARLKEKTGIDPLTISQTSCRGGGDTVRLAMPPAGQVAGSFDVLVDHPDARFVHGRPRWRVLAGDRAIRIPAALRPVAGWRVIEARLIGEPDTSVPLDRVAIRPGEDIALMLPPGRYRVRGIDVARATVAPPEAKP